LTSLRARCSSPAKSPLMPCCTHSTRVGAGCSSFWCSSACIACGCPSAVLVLKQTHALHLRATQSISDCGNGWGFVLVRALAATWGSESIRNGSVAHHTFDWGELEQAAPRATSAPMLFSAGWVCSAVTSFSSHEVQRLRREFPHHLVHDFRGDLGQPVFVAALLWRSCPKAFRIHLGCDWTSGAKLFRACPQRMLREDNALGLRR